MTQLITVPGTDREANLSSFTLDISIIYIDNISIITTNIAVLQSDFTFGLFLGIISVPGLCGDAEPYPDRPYSSYSLW